jgi:hypothetical protein
MSIYLNNPWKPKKHTIIREDSLAQQLHEQGFGIQNLIDQDTIAKIQKLFDEHHNLTAANGGMFYSVYSQDLVYRKKMHDSLAELLRPITDKICKDYKMMLNSFVVKISGPESEFYLHQDTTGLDEWKYSPLSLWIPLQDVDESNGCLGLIPCSQHFFSPYRSISFPSPFDHIQTEVKAYLQPQKMKVGEVLVFDNRVLHHSYKNESGKVRVALICGLFPKEAQMQTCHKEAYVCGGEVELINQEDDFLLKGTNFLIDCQKRPSMGLSVGFVKDPFFPIEKEDFVALCNRYELNNSTMEDGTAPTHCKMIAEPVLTDIKAPSLWEKIKELF